MSYGADCVDRENSTRSRKKSNWQTPLCCILHSHEPSSVKPWSPSICLMTATMRLPRRSPEKSVQRSSHFAVRLPKRHWMLILRRKKTRMQPKGSVRNEIYDLECPTDCCVEIRMAILDGFVDDALALTHRYYPRVLNDNPQIFFRLKCRKFVEMMRLSTEYLDAASDPGSVQKRGKKGSVNGHHATAHSDDGMEAEMDLDEPPVILGGKNMGDRDWDRMDTEDGQVGRQIEATLKHTDLVNEMVLYGRELKQQFKEDQSSLVTETMREIFGMFAYPDPRKSEQAHLLDKSERIPVAEALNSAILGKLSFFIPLRMCQSTMLTSFQSRSANLHRRRWSDCSSKPSCSPT